MFPHLQCKIEPLIIDDAEALINKNLATKDWDLVSVFDHRGRLYAVYQQMSSPLLEKWDG